MGKFGNDGDPLIDENKSQKSLNSIHFIWILLYFLLCFNIFFFIIYRLGHQSENIAIQLWNYSGSDTFNIISVSLILPIVVIFLESHLEIIKEYRKRQALREKEKEEERKEKEKKLEEKQQDCIKKAAEILIHFNNLASEIIYFEEDNQKGEKIEDLLIKADNQSNSTKEFINIIEHQFPNLSDDVIDLILFYINVVQLSYIHIAKKIWKEGWVTKEIKELRMYLSPIIGGVKHISMNRILDIMKYHMKLKNANEEERIEYEEKIQCIIDDLQYYKDEIIEIEKEYNNIFPYSHNDEKVKAFLKEYEGFRNSIPNKKIRPKEYNRDPNLRSLFEVISSDNLNLDYQFEYTDEYFKKLSTFLHFEQFVIEAYW